MKLSVKQFIRKNIRKTSGKHPELLYYCCCFHDYSINNSKNIFPEVINFICDPVELDYDKAFTNNNLIDINAYKSRNKKDATDD